jgi:AcrR family transcriptional regulator
LTREQVVEAVLRLGLEDFTMKRVAAELSVSIATLYQYVTDRDELLRLAVSRQMASLPFPADNGQHWSVFLREYARGIVEVLASDPHVLVRLIVSGSSMEAELQLVEAFLGFMKKRGFSEVDGMRIMHQATGAAFATAVFFHRDRMRAQRSGSLPKTAQEALTHYPDDALPLVRRAFDVYARQTDPADLVLLEPLIASIAEERAEELPTPPITPPVARTRTRSRAGSGR